MGCPDGGNNKIFSRLYELAVREKLLSDPAFESLPVPLRIVVSNNGEYQGIIEARPPIKIPPKKKGGEVKTKRGPGVEIDVPRPHGNTASQGFARFFIDTIPRVLPYNTDPANAAKEARSRETFWKQIEHAADETDLPSVKAVREFGRKLLVDAELVTRIQAEIKQIDPGVSDRITFSVGDDHGKSILEDPSLRQWYAKFFQKFTASRQEDGPEGFCSITVLLDRSERATLRLAVCGPRAD